MTAGIKPKGKVNLQWSSEFAYALGLITTDGNLSSDKWHINFTAKDFDLVETFKSCLGISNRIGRKSRGGNSEKKYFQVQFGDVLFYNFLTAIGLTPAKSKTIGAIKIPDEYFQDFLRGHFDGDGTFYSYWDSRWKSSFMFYTVFISASIQHIQWLRERLSTLLGVTGHVASDGRRITYHLKYAKKESIKIIKFMYQNNFPCLQRKLLKIESVLGTI